MLSITKAHAQDLVTHEGGQTLLICKLMFTLIGMTLILLKHIYYIHTHASATHQEQSHAANSHWYRRPSSAAYNIFLHLHAVVICHILSLETKQHKT